VCDDAFISFRYIDHWLQGQGLVFNPGERVEGFTHFLWLVLLASLHRLGLDLPTLGKYLPLLFFAALLGVLAWRSYRERDSKWLGLPIAAWGVALHYDAQTFASGGLETMPFAFLLLTGLLVVTARRPRYALAGVVYALASLTRPEGVLYTGIAGVYVLWRTRALRPALRFSLPWVLCVVPFLLFRISYYGDLLPNTYYAKSAGSAYWSQGWEYTRLYFGIYLVLLLCAAAIPTSWVLRRRRGGALDAALLAGVQVLLTVVYVARVGGDFMFARFFIPMTPLLYLVCEDVLRSFGHRWLQVVAAVVVVGWTLQARLPRAKTLVGREKVHGIVDEPNYYTAETLAVLRHQGEVLGKYLRGTRARVGLLSGQDAVAYYGHLPYALEAQGLTDAELARRPLAQRGRPGHERGVTMEDLLHKRIHFRLRYGFTVHMPLYKQIRFDDLYGEIVHYDAALMQSFIGRNGIAFYPFPNFIDQKLESILQQAPRPALQEYVEFQIFYFAFNDDAPLFRRIRAAYLEAGFTETQLQEAERVAAEFLQKAGVP
jgi:hypothetical protein